MTTRQTQLERRLLAQECELCHQTSDLEVHHLKALKDIKKKYQGKRPPPPWVQFMMARHRKQIVVCNKCHKSIHSGQYDGAKIN